MAVKLWEVCESFIYWKKHDENRRKYLMIKN